MISIPSTHFTQQRGARALLGARIPGHRGSKWSIGQLAPSDQRGISVVVEAFPVCSEVLYSFTSIFSLY